MDPKGISNWKYGLWWLSCLITFTDQCLAGGKRPVPLPRGTGQWMYWNKTGLEPCPCFPNFLARTTFVLVFLWETKIPGQDAIFGDFVLVPQIPSKKHLFYFNPTLRIHLSVRSSVWVYYNSWSLCTGVVLLSTPVLFVEFRYSFHTFFFIFSSHFSSYFPHIYALFWQIYDFFIEFTCFL